MIFFHQNCCMLVTSQSHKHTAVFIINKQFFSTFDKEHTIFAKYIVMHSIFVYNKFKSKYSKFQCQSVSCLYIFTWLEQSVESRGLYKKCSGSGIQFCQTAVFSMRCPARITICLYTAKIPTVSPKHAITTPSKSEFGNGATAQLKEIPMQ